MTIKPYLLWAGDNYYPGSALSDYKGSFNTVEEAEAVGLEKHSSNYNAGQPVYDWYSVVEHKTMKQVCYGWGGNRVHG